MAAVSIIRYCLCVVRNETRLNKRDYLHNNYFLCGDKFVSLLFTLEWAGNDVCWTKKVLA